MDLVERIEAVRLGKTDSNCFGTALYLIGIIETDTFQSEDSAEKHLKVSEKFGNSEVVRFRGLTHEFIYPKKIASENFPANNPFLNCIINFFNYHL